MTFNAAMLGGIGRALSISITSLPAGISQMCTDGGVIDWVSAGSHGN